MTRTNKKKKSAKEREQDLLKLVLDLKTQNEALAKSHQELGKRNRDLNKLTKAQAEALRFQSSSSDSDGSDSDKASAAAAAANPPPKLRTSPRRSPRRKKRRASPPRREKKRTPPKKQKRKTRRHRQTKSDSSEDSDGAPVVRRLSDSVERRRSKTERERFLRKTLGSVIKLNMDEQILSGYFRQGKTFDKDKFEDHVRPIIQSIMQGSDVDTEGFTPYFIFKMAVDICKKRENYKPRTPTTELQVKNERSVYGAANRARYLRTKAAARKIYMALQTKAAATKLSNTSTTAAAAAADAAAAAAAAATAATTATDLTNSDVEREFATDSAGDEMKQLEQYNKEMQAKRNAAKADMADKKQAAAELQQKKKPPQQRKKKTPQS